MKIVFNNLDESDKFISKYNNLPESNPNYGESAIVKPRTGDYVYTDGTFSTEREVNKQLRQLLKECKANFIHRKQLLEKLEELEKPTIDILTRINTVISESEER